MGIDVSTDTIVGVSGDEAMIATHGVDINDVWSKCTLRRINWTTGITY